MEKSTNQSKHITFRVRLKSADTNLNGESRIYYFILPVKIRKPLDLNYTLRYKIKPN